MGITTDQIDGIVDGNVVTTDGHKIGGIGQIYLDDNSGEPNWVTVKTGLFGTSESFVPLDGADLRSGDIVVDFDKATIKDAPRVDADGRITPEEEDTLYLHYGLGDGGAGDEAESDSAVADTTETGDAGRVRLRKYVLIETVTDDATVTEEVRTEKVDTDSDEERPTR